MASLYWMTRSLFSCKTKATSVENQNLLLKMTCPKLLALTILVKLRRSVSITPQSSLDSGFYCKKYSIKTLLMYHTEIQTRWLAQWAACNGGHTGLGAIRQRRTAEAPQGTWWWRSRTYSFLWLVRMCDVYSLVRSQY